MIVILQNLMFVIQSLITNEITAMIYTRTSIRVPIILNTLSLFHYLK